MANENNQRINSIDLLRGIVMVIMALDHVRDFIHYGAYFNDPANLSTTTPALFFTRWITHFCAPVFVFLAGTAAFLYGVKQPTKKALARFLFTRGLWLIFAELVIVNLGISFDIYYSIQFFQVIWAIGFCMIVLAALIYLPLPAIVGVGAALVLGHNLLDGISFSGTSPMALIWYALHQPSFMVTSSTTAVFLVYPVLPWIGLMALGYALGSLYQRGADAARRKRVLWQTGLAAIFLFVVLRTFNLYGDPAHWVPQETFAYSAISFFNVTKYPPSLCFLLMTMGPALLFLAWTDNRFRSPQGFFATIGRVPFFYYIVHFYVAHLMGVFGVLLEGRPWTDMIFNAKAFMQPRLLDYGYSLPITYGVWLLVIAIMYPLCKWYDKYKRNNKDKWWLSYL